jgi:hypothetical protein
LQKTLCLKTRIGLISGWFEIWEGVNGLQTVLGLTSVVSPEDGFRKMKSTGELIKRSAEKEELLLKFPYRYSSQNLRKMTQGVYGQWKRDYCLEQERRLLEYQRKYQRKAS